MSQHLYAMHDFSPDWASIIRDAGKTGWTVITEEIGDDPTNKSGQDYRHLASFNITPIVRLNYSHHGQGTIPLSNRYDMFAQRCANFVTASQGCTHWIIGNEPNIKVEQFGGIPIMPKLYAECFYRCRNAIKQRGIQHQVIVAGVAPYNVETGMWIDYWIEMLNAIQMVGGADGLSVHTYSRGSNPSSITSNDKMGSPYSAYYNGFRAYRDFLYAVPILMRNLPVYITETDQLDPWADTNSGWVQVAYQEIEDWNKSNDKPKIYCLTLYRWENYDQWGIKGKNGVIQDFKEAVRRDYKTPETVQENVIMKGTVTAQFLNVRSGPGTNTPVVGSLAKGNSVEILEKSSAGETLWYRIGDKRWVSANWVSVGGVTEPAPVPAGDNWSRSYAFVRKWEGGFQNIHNDRGNWTGGAVGVGELKGTKYGISAASYPNLDIKNITSQQAEQIYLTDYWQRSGASALSYPACLIVMDTAVLHGVGAAKSWLAEVGPNAYIFVARRLRSYLKADNWEFWDEAWIGRVVDLLEYVGKSS